MNYEDERLSLGLIIFVVLLLAVVRSCVPLRTWEPGCSGERQATLPPPSPTGENQ